MRWTVGVFLVCCLALVDALIVHRAHVASWAPRGSRFALSSSRSSGGGSQRGPAGGGANLRQLRVARSLRDELTDIICGIDIKANVYPSENLLRCTSISEVEVSPDLSYAKVFISVLGNSVEKRQIFVWLCENVGQIRFSLGKRLKHMRRVPELIFKLSDSQATSDLISLIDELAPSKAKPSAGDYEVELTEDDDEED